jgi:hypothetical protein
MYDYCIDPRRNVTIINHTTIIVNNYRYGNNYGFRSGPRRYDAERHIGRINPVRFRQSNTPGRTVFRNNEINVYRPNVRRDNSNRTIAPRRFDRYDANAANRGRNDNATRNNGQVNTNSERRVFERNTNQGNNPAANNGNRRLERRDDGVRPQQQNNPANTPERRRLERKETNPSTTTPGRVVTPREQRPERTVDPSNNGNTRRFERKEPVVRPQQQQTPPRQNNPSIERRRIERTDNGNQQPRQQPQRVERKPEVRPQQVERRQEPRVQKQQQPARQIERRDNGNSGKGNGNDKGNGKRKF